MTRGFVSATRSASTENRRTSRRGAISPLRAVATGEPYSTPNGFAQAEHQWRINLDSLASVIQEPPGQAAPRADDGALQETSTAAEEQANGSAGDRSNTGLLADIRP
jgi:hypothetical protein